MKTFNLMKPGEGVKHACALLVLIVMAIISTSYHNNILKIKATLGMRGVARFTFLHSLPLLLQRAAYDVSQPGSRRQGRAWERGHLWSHLWPVEIPGWRSQGQGSPEAARDQEESLPSQVMKLKTPTRNTDTQSKKTKSSKQHKTVRLISIPTTQQYLILEKLNCF